MGWSPERKESSLCAQTPSDLKCFADVLQTICAWIGKPLAQFAQRCSTRPWRRPVAPGQKYPTNLFVWVGPLPRWQHQPGMVSGQRWFFANASRNSTKSWAMAMIFLSLIASRENPFWAAFFANVSRNSTKSWGMAMIFSVGSLLARILSESSVSRNSMNVSRNWTKTTSKNRNAYFGLSSWSILL